MNGVGDISEIVLLFDGAGSDVDGIASEMRFEEFEALLNHSANLDGFAASMVHAAYTAVGDGLIVKGIVFFKIAVDENGYMDQEFNLPLRYLLRHAGPGPDLGSGPIRMACRGQCSVPWHATHLWEPAGEDDAHPAVIVQKAVLRNRLGLKVLGGGSVTISEVEEPADPELLALHQRVVQAFGTEGKVSVRQLIEQHNVQLGELKDQHRDQLLGQQQNYLEQVRECRDEIQRLKTALRHEQNRNRRLQMILRGEVGR